jgi:hypothetical protein
MNKSLQNEKGKFFSIDQHLSLRAFSRLSCITTHGRQSFAFDRLDYKFCLENFQRFFSNFSLSIDGYLQTISRGLSLDLSTAKNITVCWKLLNKKKK